MAIKINISDRVTFKVAGTFTDEAGAAQAFDFRLVARRVGQSDLQGMLEDDALKVADFMDRIVLDWHGVMDDEGKPVPFSPEGLARLWQLPGVALLAFKAYLADVGARAKN